MHIYWHGQNCFKIVGKEVTIITDPFDKKLGIKPPRTSADIVTLSSDEYEAGAIKNDPLIFNTPGEYEAKGALMRGLWSYRDNQAGKINGINIVFTIELEGIRICHLGDIGHQLDEKLESRIDGVLGDVILQLKSGTILFPGLPCKLVLSRKSVMPLLRKDIMHTARVLKTLLAFLRHLFKRQI